MTAGEHKPKHRVSVLNFILQSASGLFYVYGYATHPFDNQNLTAKDRT